MRYVPFRPARLQVHTRRAARGTHRYVRESLAINPNGLPWHRGLVAVGNIAMAIVLAYLLKQPSAAYLAVGFALFFTLSDAEGTLAMRLHAIGWAAGFMALGSITALLVIGQPVAIVAAFCILTFVAGVLSWAGLPFLRAPRFGAVIFCFVLASDLQSLSLALLLLAGTFVTAGLWVTLEHVLVPDTTRTAYSTFAIAWRLINADRYTVLRFASCYLIASAIGWSAGRAIDETHPTWVAISVLVVMWPDWQTSYRRVLQRVFGTLIGAAIALVVAPRIEDPRLLIAIIVALFFFIPFGVRRNYWLHCALMALVVFFAMNIATDDGFTRHAVEERVADIVLGCSIAILGTLFAFRKRDRSGTGRLVERAVSRQ